MEKLYFCLALLLFSETLGSFPENSKPISIISREDVNRSVFTGGETVTDRLSYVQDIKRMTIAGRDVLAITSRNNLYILDPDAISPSKVGKINYDQIYTWASDSKRKSLCVRKGQTEENCGNYLRVLESMDAKGDKLVVCATNSYSPLCKYITASSQATGLRLSAEDETFSGAEKCAFGPDQTGVSLYTGGDLYSGTVSEFSGRSYTITRSLGETKQLRTPKYDTKFINEPVFVKMIDDGDRVLIFMNEIVPTKSGDIRMVAHVAQLCKNDRGGQHVLARQWTKFVKTRLNCSMNGFYFDQLQDISDPVQVHAEGRSNATETMVFATFTTPDNSVPGSAVCAYTIDSIHDALKSRFQDDRSDARRPTGNRHPGFCPKEQFTESELQFLKTHPLLEDQVRGSLLNTYVGERWTSIAVDTAAGPYQNWTVYFVGTSSGALLRYLSPSSGAKSGTLLARQEIFDSSICDGNSTDNAAKRVTNVLIDPERDNVIVAFKHCIITVPLRACPVHKCKESCVASGDPYCGWNGKECVSYISPNVNVEQYVIKSALNPKTNVDDLCPPTDPFFGTKKDNEKKEDVDATTTGSKQENEDEGAKEAEKPANGTTTDSEEDTGRQNKDPESLPQESVLFEDGYLKWTAVVVIAISVAVLSFGIGFIVNKYCCGGTFDKSAEDGIEQSKASIVAPTNIFTKAAHSIMASISPKRRRRPPPSASQSITTLSQPTETPLLAKSNKDDETGDVPDGVGNVPSVSANTLPYQTRPNGSRLNSIASNSQVTMNGSVTTYNPKRRASHNHMTASVSSMGSKPPPPSYATAPRPRHPSGNRSSDPGTARMMSVPDEFSSMRVDTRGNKRSRHSTPVPPVPASPCRSDLSAPAAFNFSRAREEAEQVINSTEHTLKGVEEVIALQQRRSQEMEPLEEDPNESRPRHDSTDSGKGSSPRNSMQTEEEHNRVPTLPRPANLELGNRGRRKRLNSEPTSPAPHDYYHPLPPPSAHKPVVRSVSMRAQQQQQPAMPFLMTNGYHRQRGGSFSANSQPSTPSGQPSPPRSTVSQQSYNPNPQQQQLIYATLPTNPNGSGGRRGHGDKISRQQSYDTYSPHNQNRYVDHNGHAVVLPDKYASLPLRGQARRSKNNPITAQYPGQPQAHRLSGGAMPQQHPHYQQQWSGPSPIYEHQRPASAQRLRYVPTPTVPTHISSTLPETNAV